MTKIKLCGLSRIEEIEAANELKPEYIGFVFAPKSRRYVAPETAAELKKQLSGEIQAAGVFVNESVEKIAELLEAASEPLSGTGLAERFGVSRQAIVQDIARLRDSGCPVRATAAGYSLDRQGCRVRRLVAVRHAPGDVREELLTVVGGGGRVIDVIVDHPVYGELRGNIDAKTVG